MKILEKLDHLPIVLYMFSMSFLNIMSFLIGYIVTDEYLMKYLDFAIRKTKLRSEMTAILLLNIGNGLPELMTGIIFGQRNEIKCSIYATAGGLLFITTVVLGTTIFTRSKSVYIPSKTFYKNITFLSISILFLLISFLTNNISLPLGLMMISAYIGFIVYTFFTCKNTGEEIETVNDRIAKGKFRAFFEKFLKPIRFFLDISILNKKRFNNNYFSYVYSVFVNTLIFTLLHDLFTTKLFIAEIPFIIISSTFLYCCETLFNFQIVMIFYDLFVSTIWIYYASDLLVYQIDAFNAKFGVSKEFASLIFIAIGNSFADLITNCIASNKGLVRTAIASSLTSPIHNTLFNLGNSYLFLLFTQKKFSFNLDHNSSLEQIPIVFSAITIFLLAFNYEIRNRKLERELAAVLFIVYALFFILVFAQIKFSHLVQGFV